MSKASGIRAGRAYIELGLKDGVTTGLSRVERRLKSFGAGLRGIARNFRELGDMTRDASLRMMAVSGLAATPFIAAGKTFANFEEMMARVKALTRANEYQFKTLEGEAIRLGKTTVFWASDAAEAMYHMAKAGFSVNKIMKTTETTMNMAAAGHVSMAEAANTAVVILAGAGIKTRDFTHAVDVLTAAMSTANMDLRDLGFSFKYAAPIARFAGLQFEETAAAIQVLANAGMAGDLAGTSLRGEIMALAAPTEKAKEILKLLGISVRDSAGNFLPLFKIIEQFEDKLKGLGSAEKAEILGELFDTRQVTGFAAMISAGSKDLAEKTAALVKATGEAKRIAKIQLDTLKGDVILLGSAFEALQLTVAKAFSPVLRKITMSLRDVIKQFSAWVTVNKEYVVAAVGTIASVFALSASLYLVSTAAAGLSAGFIILSKVVVVLKAAVIALKLVFTGLFVLLGAFSSPIGAIVVGLGAAAAAIIAFKVDFGSVFDGAVKKLGEMASVAKESFGAIGAALSGGDLAAAAQLFWATMKYEWEMGAASIVEVVRRAYEEIKEIANSIVDVGAIVVNELSPDEKDKPNSWDPIADADPKRRQKAQERLDKQLTKVRQLRATEGKSTSKEDVLADPRYKDYEDMIRFRGKYDPRFSKDDFKTAIAQDKIGRVNQVEAERKARESAAKASLDAAKANYQKSLQAAYLAGPKKGYGVMWKELKGVGLQIRDNVVGEFKDMFEKGKEPLIEATDNKSLSEMTEKVAPKFGSLGTFSSDEAEGMGEQIKYVIETATAVKDIRRMLQNAGVKVVI